MNSKEARIAAAIVFGVLMAIFIAFVLAAFVFFLESYSDGKTFPRETCTCECVRGDIAVIGSKRRYGSENKQTKLL